MMEQWQELKETIIELRDNDGTGTQQEVCKFLANYMEVLEKQIQEPKVGYWTLKDEELAVCPCCWKSNKLYGDYCKWCGAKLQ